MPQPTAPVSTSSNGLQTKPTRVLTNTEQLFALFERYGASHYGEDVSQTQHMIQCALLAEQEGESATMIVACLLHDIGHFVGVQADHATPDTDFKHEALGAMLLKSAFGAAVYMPVALHVEAKRYRCAQAPEYFDGLSAASKHSLALQGGAMTAKQCQNFESKAYFREALRLRDYDDRAKSMGLVLPELGYFHAYIEGCARFSPPVTSDNSKVRQPPAATP